MKIVVGGQIEKEALAAALADEFMKQRQIVEIAVLNDIEAAMAIQSGSADYYFGACNTGGGGALAMAIAILGAGRCVTLGMPGKILSDNEIAQAVHSGKVAFGFTAQDIGSIVPLVVSLLVAKNGS
ncbi:DUF2620 domain-containing protein [Testudinibacter sp. TR-2022]|uniref:DUF2620 domain-containing protein n=1 Tax=Testudinibacter sp. TR-2022 TaxID=2585029 RepID=UPI00111839E4|nr:DUF2620 domain-containing protein [Testudinibacter sp. TR-2022]TNH04801.1 DUF2620 domain-containing protein [Pasteurellaceae bacterium Phil31]TNH06116.1 DUF2620 domain-containing protein [Testudinibacter sp. TR-2022]TNH10995.1 DUF2620 domain-containing protein [Testudinibacter sp. TR-2022]TNH11526.1 DUF2620 domain-containing protein [Testudinibacter sp. TR-2022]TNH14969.1 DUF2620 domain-containing protein [Testudinibacter sp. TR-2022]